MGATTTSVSEPATLLDRLQRVGIRVWIEGEELRAGPRALLTAEHVAALRVHKPQLLALLTQPVPESEQAEAQAADRAEEGQAALWPDAHPIILPITRRSAPVAPQPPAGPPALGPGITDESVPQSRCPQCNNFRWQLLSTERHDGCWRWACVHCHPHLAGWLD